MSDSEFDDDDFIDEDEDFSDEEEDEDSIEDDDDSEEVARKSKKRSLNKLETKIAMQGQVKMNKKSKPSAAPKKKREEKKESKDLKKDQKGPKEPKVSKEHKEPKEPKEPKEAKKQKAPKEPKPEVEKVVKKTQKELKEEKKEEDRLNDLAEDKIYFYKKLNDEEKIRAQADIQEFVLQILDSKYVPLQVLADLVLRNNLANPKANSDFLINELRQEFTKHEVQADLCFKLFEQLTQTIYQLKPSILQTMFFPNRDNEKRLAAVLRKAKKSLDICVFAFTNDRLRDAIITAFNNGAQVRIISDDECSKFMGADIYQLGLLGIPCTMDDNQKVHMHNKFAIVDKIVLVTGSFNWTSQAVNQNQENLIVIENAQLIDAYQQEYDKLWEQFSVNRLTKEACVQRLEEEEKTKVLRVEKMNEARKQKQAEKNNNK